MLNGVNWGNVASWGGIVFGICSAIGYAFAQDWRRMLYFFFAFCITMTICWPRR